MKNHIHFVNNFGRNFNLFDAEDIKTILKLDCHDSFFMINNILVKLCKELDYLIKLQKYLKEDGYDCVALCIALGIDPNKNTLFFESSVMNHYELGAIINLYNNEVLDRNFKHEKNLENCIEISKILLYNSLSFSENNNSCYRKLQKFIFQIVSDINEDFGKLFTVPHLLDTTPGSNIRSRFPHIVLTCPKNLVVKKLKGAVTDSDNRIYYDPIHKPNISSILEIFSFCSGKGISQLENHYSGMNNYETFKMDCAEAINTFLEPIQKIFYEIRPDEKYLEKILTFGKNKAKDHADIVLTKVKEELGIL